MVYTTFSQAIYNTLHRPYGISEQLFTVCSGEGKKMLFADVCNTPLSLKAVFLLFIPPKQD